MEYYIYTSELYHHGTKGMKWGRRLYQNKDGSLTALGKKRRASLEGKISKLEAKNNKLGGKKESDETSEAPKQKTASEMTNKELQEHTTRMTLEANYYNAQKNLANATPKQIVETSKFDKGKELAEKFVKDNVLPAIGKTTQTAIENYMKKQLGLNVKDELTELRRTADILDAKQRIDKHKNPDKYLSYEERTKKYNLEESRRKASDEYKELVNAKTELDKVRKELEEERKRREQGGN